jgi:hypothetical protein
VILSNFNIHSIHPSHATVLPNPVTDFLLLFIGKNPGSDFHILVIGKTSGSVVLKIPAGPILEFAITVLASHPAAGRSKRWQQRDDSVSAKSAAVKLCL